MLLVEPRNCTYSNSGITWNNLHDGSTNRKQTTFPGCFGASITLRDAQNIRLPKRHDHGYSSPLQQQQSSLSQTQLCHGFIWKSYYPLQQCRDTQAGESLPPSTLRGQWLSFEFHKTSPTPPDNIITPNMEIAPLRPELIASHLRPYNFNLAHKPTQSLRSTLVRVKDRLPTQKQRNVV